MSTSSPQAAPSSGREYFVAAVTGACVFMLFMLCMVFTSTPSQAQKPAPAPEPQRIELTIRFAPFEFSKPVPPQVKFSMPEPKQEPL